MNLLVAWPDWNTRPDRCLMFAETAEWLDQVNILTAKPLAKNIRERLHPKAQVINLGADLHGFSFRKAARKTARKHLISAYANYQRVILHDLSIARLLPEPIRPLNKSPRLVRSVLSLYSPTYSNFINRSWRKTQDQPLHFRQEFVYWKSVLLRLPLEYYACQQADLIIGNSEQIRQDVITAYHKKPEKVFFVPSEVDVEYFYPVHARQEPDTPTILFCGRMYTRKGIFDLLEAVSRLYKKGLSFRVQLVGENNLESGQINQFIQENEIGHIVSILPYQPREIIRELMHSCTIFVLPSYLEGSPRVVKEAMASGCPVITYDIPGTRSLDPSGKALRLVHRGNITELTRAIASLLLNKDERDRLGKAGMQKMQEQFGLQSVAQQMVMLYELAFQE